MKSGTVVARFKTQRDRSGHNIHPWVYSGALEQANLGPCTGEPVELQDSRGEFIAWAQYNPGSKIRLRILTRHRHHFPDETWYKAQIAKALTLRNPWQNQETTAMRLVFSEADGLPGLIVDRMGDYIVVQFLTEAMDSLAETITRLLVELCPQFLPPPFVLKGIIERSDGDGRSMEGLPARQGMLWGDAPEKEFTILESGIPYFFDPFSQKTGFYTDQRHNRIRVASYVANRRVLDACCFTGSFACHALRGGASSITIMDSSQDALTMAERNLHALKARLSKETNCRILESDVFAGLRKLRKDGETFDLIILDPPKLAPTRKSLEKAMGAYKDINLQAMALLDVHGILATFSCSGLVSMDDLSLWCAWASRDLGMEFQILEHTWQAPCHPVPLHYPEAQYLKGLILQRMT